MKGSFFWKLMFLFCALAGCLAGYGFFHLVNEGAIFDYVTKDNTLVRKWDDSVFFDGEKLLSDLGQEIEERLEELIKMQEDGTEADSEKSGRDVVQFFADTVEKNAGEDNIDSIGKEKLSEEEEIAEKRIDVEAIEQTEADRQTIEGKENQSRTDKEEELVNTTGTDDTISTAGSGIETSLEKEENVDLGTLSEALLLDGLPGYDTASGIIQEDEMLKTVPEQETTVQSSEEEQNETEPAFTYPAEIFGQVPVINRSDAYVTYFEFAHDLIELMEPEVKQRKLNETALFAEFALKALFCGVEIQNLDINAPITRKEAALTLWLASDILEEDGSDTSASFAEQYATDVKNCSGSEKRAIAYLYEQGILSGYQIGNQKFAPEDYLTTEIGENWLIRVEQCWK